MENKAKEEIVKMRSLMERMDKNQTFHQAMINEDVMLNEAIRSDAKQVTRDEIIDLLNSMDEKSAGKFVSLTYVNAKNAYATKRNWRESDVTDALNKYSDRSEEDWHKQLTQYNDPSIKGKNPVSTVVVAQRYLVHWTTQEKFAQQYGEYSNALHNLRMRHGVAIERDGVLGDNNNQRTRSDYGSTINQTGNLSKDLNTAKKKVTTTCYLVDETGHIVSEIPHEVLKSMSALPSPAKPEKEVAEALSGPALDAYMQAKAELDKTFFAQNFIFDKILTIVATIDGQQYYYINDALKSPISKKSDVYINPQEMVEIAKEQLGASFDAINGFAN